MEHFIKTAFWIVTLCGCIHARAVDLQDLNIRHIQKNVICVQNSTVSASTFYTPKNMQPDCITKALECVMKEFNGTVRDECTDPLGYIDRTLDFLQSMISERKQEKHTEINSTECDCHTWPQAPFSEFLNNTLILLQLHKSTL